MVLWQDLLAGLALVLIVEGVLPFVRPGKWRFMIASIAKKPDRTLRLMGLLSMLLGCIVLTIVR